MAVLTLGSALERSDQRPDVYGVLGAVWLDIANERNDTVDLRKTTRLYFNGSRDRNDPRWVMRFVKHLNGLPDDEETRRGQF